jgi:hypothetical protein
VAGARLPAVSIRRARHDLRHARAAPLAKWVNVIVRFAESEWPGENSVSFLPDAPIDRMPNARQWLRASAYGCVVVLPQTRQVGGPGQRSPSPARQRQRGRTGALAQNGRQPEAAPD